MPVSKFRAYVAQKYHHMMAIRDTPHAIAGGVAIGVFISFTPVVGLKTLLSIFVAWLGRCSKLAAALAVTFHDILLPVWPLVLVWQYRIGFWLLSHPHHLPPRLPSGHLTPEYWLHWRTLEAVWPMAIGSVIMAAPVSMGCYFLTLKIVARHREKARQKATPEDKP